MKDYSEIRKQAVEHLKAADKLLNKTYPVANDPKMLLSVLESLYNCFDKAIKAALMREKKKADSNFSKNLESFRKIGQRYGASKERIMLIDAVKTAFESHKSSSVEFARKGDYVICLEEYKDLKILSEKDLKIAISKAKLFIADINNILS